MYVVAITMNFITDTGARTPSYGGFVTPSHDPSQTPQHSGGSAWDPSVANTPARYSIYQSYHQSNVVIKVNLLFGAEWMSGAMAMINQHLHLL